MPVLEQIRNSQISLQISAPVTSCKNPLNLFLTFLYDCKPWASLRSLVPKHLHHVEWRRHRLKREQLSEGWWFVSAVP